MIVYFFLQVQINVALIYIIIINILIKYFKNILLINPKNTTQCFLESSKEKGLKCDTDYFYDSNKYMIGEENYKKYKNTKGYCTFIYGDLKGAFIYEHPIENDLNINEINGLTINCLNYQNLIKMKVFTFVILFFLVL